MKRLLELLKGIRFQLVFAFVVITVLLASVIASVSIYYLRSAARDDAVKQTILRSKQIGLQAEALLNKAEIILDWGSAEIAYNFLNTQDNKQKIALQLIREMNTYRASNAIDDSIFTVYLFGIDGVVYDERKGVCRIERYPENQRIFDSIREMPGILIHITGDDGEEYIVYGERVGQHATEKTIGYAAVKFKKQVFGHFLGEEENDSASYALIDSRGEIIASEGVLMNRILQETTLYDLLPDSEYGILRRNGRNVIVTRDKIAYTDWTLACASLMNDVSEQFKRAYLYVILTAVLGTAACILVYQRIARRMTWPIYRMKDKMLEVGGGNLEASIDENSFGEFIVLEDQYNHMLEKIKWLMEKNREDQKALQKAELSALQAQIAPHFLYNTLDTIIWLVAAGENEKAMETIENLSIFFKTGLSKGVDWVGVQREIEHVRSYLSIQQSRYSDILSYEIHVDESMLHYDMLKMILQPIVENAIYHGIKNTAVDGKIEILGWMEGDCLYFEVRDNGAGMEAEEAESLNRRMQENTQPYEDKENGFGLYNVNRRIRLYYGDGYGIRIHSARDEGTTVSIRLGRMEHRYSDE